MEGDSMTPNQLQAIRERAESFDQYHAEIWKNDVLDLLAEVERLEKQLATVGELAVDAFIVQNADKFTWLTLDDIERRRRARMEEKP